VNPVRKRWRPPLNRPNALPYPTPDLDSPPCTALVLVCRRRLPAAGRSAQCLPCRCTPASQTLSVVLLAPGQLLNHGTCSLIRLFRLQSQRGISFSFHGHHNQSAVQVTSRHQLQVNLGPAPWSLLESWKTVAVHSTVKAARAMRRGAQTTAPSLRVSLSSMKPKVIAPASPVPRLPAGSSIPDMARRKAQPHRDSENTGLWVPNRTLFCSGRHHGTPNEGDQAGQWHLAGEFAQFRSRQAPACTCLERSCHNMGSLCPTAPGAVPLPVESRRDTPSGSTRSRKRPSLLVQVPSLDCLSELPKPSKVQNSGNTM
jgi:hypothetical protein